MAEFAGSQAQAIIEIDPRTALFLQVGQKITAKVQDITLEGTISAISTIARQNMLSTVRIAFDDAKNYIGQSAEITFSIPENISSAYLLPINAIKIIAEGEGEIQTLVNGKIISEKVKLGSMYGSSIEVFTELESNRAIITSDVSQFNEETQTLQVENNEYGTK